MNTLTHPPVQKARGKLRSMSADEEARCWAEAREKALRDEATLLAAAREDIRACFDAFEHEWLEEGSVGRWVHRH
jgi:hypothetical protein